MIKIGVIGAGHIANRFSEAVQKSNSGGLLEAIASRDIKKAKEYQKKYGFNKAYGDYQSLYLDKDIDLIYVATPHAFHYEQMMEILDYGKHIICEKSFTLNALQAKEVFNKAKEKKLFVMEAMWTRFLPTIIKVNELIKVGIIGDVKYLTADFSIRAIVNKEHRLRNLSLGGGALLDLGIYPLTLAKMILGKSNNYSLEYELDEITGVDIRETIKLEYIDSYAILKSGFKEKLPEKAVVFGTNGKIVINEFYQATKAVFYDKDDSMIKIIHKPFEVNGFEYEIKSAIQSIEDGLIENSIMPHQETIEILELMDDLRNKMNLKYPKELILNKEK